MRLARESHYAIEALLVLSRSPHGMFVSARDIGSEAGLPLAYLHKILRLLAEAGVVDSRRGRGYSLARPADATTLREVLTAVEGPDVFDGRCIFWREECSSENPCELHFRWREMKPQIEGAIAATTLQEIRDQGGDGSVVGFGGFRSPRS
jgi:Rrf2 family protein